ncbi:hypothetical protein ACMCNP_04710 [Candidatus Acidulodesulfobacterium sp. H_13]|uniref:hypothetical protein n=1 Tax=Candidatus Acidulodesulfobacterium sp. H_13 TaxID=3395470 RepID=UPI003AF4305F
MQIKNTQNSSCGTFDIEIIEVNLKGEKSLSSTVSSGENVTIEVSIKSKKELDNMTVGIYNERKVWARYFWYKYFSS